MEENLIPAESTVDLKEIRAAITKNYCETETAAMNPLALAYIGDAIHSDQVRRYLLGLGHQNVDFMTKTSANYVRASAQAQVVKALLPSLTETETRMVKRGRNTSSHVPKNADLSDYRYATGFEVLLGYLFLSGQHDRMNALIDKSIYLVNISNSSKKQPKKAW